MLRGHKVSWLLATALVGAVASLAPACGGAGDTGGSGSGTPGGTASSSGGNGCIPGASSMCFCDNGDPGAQVCNPQGTGFLPCNCGAGDNCGDGVVEAPEECDDGNMMNGDGCDTSCKNELCGNESKDPGECGPEGTCPQDCGNCGNGMEDPGECGMGGTCPMDCDPCKDALTFNGLVQMPSGPLWQFAGLTGIDAGNEMCKQLGADHICTHKELRKAEMHIDPVTMMNELAKIPAGTSIWLHREDTDMVNMTPGGAGARCNDWKYETNHLSDGEYCDVQAAGALACTYDNDPVYDGTGAHLQAGLNCGGVTRSIACCYEECKP